MQQKYSVNQYLISTLLAFVESGQIAIPEIQRPFVWDSTKVRDLLDSLYQGYPIGYIIAWQNPNVRLKDGTLSSGKKVLIDGQQRITALTAAILGQKVINKEYQKVKIVISFNPLSEKFEVFNSAIEKDSSWIKDISLMLNHKIDPFVFVQEYCKLNPHIEPSEIFQKIQKLNSITQKQIGLIELDSDLDIETVTEIFIRINSKGVVLSQADFAMSKIASNEIYGGNLLRKCIDYFCHLAKAPEFYTHINEVDTEFCQTEYFNKIRWLKNESDDLYDPDYNDLIRVAFTSEFHRGRLSDLVNLLSGRNFEKKIYEDNIAEESYRKLKNGVMNFVNEHNFKSFIMLIKSAGFIDSSLINSYNALNFAYIIFLKLRTEKANFSEYDRYIRKWFVMSLLTGRYSGSPESMFDTDIKRINSIGLKNYLNELISSQLSDAYWEVGLVQQLNTSNVNNPAFNVYLAALIKLNINGFLSKDILVKYLIEHKGDIHHIFPKDYLKKNGYVKSQYNQIANYVYMQTELNIKIGNKPPFEYFNLLNEQFETGERKLGGFQNIDELENNLIENDIPIEVVKYNIEDYNTFLDERRKLMAKKIKKFFNSL